MSALAPGSVLAQSFEIVRRVGAGAMGTVYEAIEIASGEHVALKIPHDIFKTDRLAIKRFVREAKATLAIRSPYVVRTLCVGKLPWGVPFFAMELIQGISLADLMDRKDRGPVPLGTALRFIDQIACGLGAAHQAGVIHRDLKPGNVLVASVKVQPVAKIFDFGLSLLAGDASNRVTMSGITFGTPQYMAPEQIRAASNVDGRADLYALGVLAYEMLAVQWPFSGLSPQDVWHAATHFDAVPLSKHRPDLPTGLCTAIMKAMARDPADRFPTADDLRAAIARYRPAATGGKA